MKIFAKEDADERLRAAIDETARRNEDQVWEDLSDDLDDDWDAVTMELKVSVRYFEGQA